MHVVETLVNVGESPVVRDVLVNLDLTGEVICGESAISGRQATMRRTFDEARQLRPALHATESGAAPGTTSDQLESAEECR